MLSKFTMLVAPASMLSIHTIDKENLPLHVIVLHPVTGRYKFDLMVCKTKLRFFILVLLTSCTGVCSYSQSGSAVDSPAIDKFVGSTPCDALIRSVLKIQPDIKCDFIKWDVSFNKSKVDTGVFQCTALYGEAQNNTNGFIGGGEKIMITGKYLIHHQMNKNPYLNLYRLDGYGLRSSVFLIQMDNNVLHFADSNKNFIIGNGGWGYVLNKIKY